MRLIRLVDAGGAGAAHGSKFRAPAEQSAWRSLLLSLVRPALLSGALHLGGSNWNNSILNFQDVPPRPPPAVRVVADPNLGWWRGSRAAYLWGRA